MPRNPGNLAGIRHGDAVLILQNLLDLFVVHDVAESQRNVNTLYTLITKGNTQDRFSSL